MIDHSFLIKTFHTNDMLGVHRLNTIEKYSLDCEILQKVGGNEKEGQHQMIVNIYSHPFQEVYVQKQEDDLRSERRDNSVHSHLQPALSLDVSLHGGIPPGRPPDWEMKKYFSTWCSIDIFGS